PPGNFVSAPSRAALLKAPPSRLYAGPYAVWDVVDWLEGRESLLTQIFGPGPGIQTQVYAYTNGNYRIDMRDPKQAQEAINRWLVGGIIPMPPPAKDSKYYLDRSDLLSALRVRGGGDASLPLFDVEDTDAGPMIVLMPTYVYWRRDKQGPVHDKA